MIARSVQCLANFVEIPPLERATSEDCYVNTVFAQLCRLSLTKKENPLMIPRPMQSLANLVEDPLPGKAKPGVYWGHWSVWLTLWRFLSLRNAIPNASCFVPAVSS